MQISFKEYLNTLKEYKRAILEGDEECIILIENGAKVIN